MSKKKDDLCAWLKSCLLWAIVGALLIWYFSGDAEAEDEERKIVDLLHMEIELITYTDPRAVFLSRYVICEKDGTYFHVSRSLLDKKMIITAGNGIQLLLPYNKGQCYSTLKTKWPEEIL